MDDYVRLLIMISICCCIVGFLMWLFLKWYKKTSIWIPLLCIGLLLVRFLYPYELPFTYSLYLTKGYPTLNRFFMLSITVGKIQFSIAHIIIGIFGYLVLLYRLFFYSTVTTGYAEISTCSPKHRIRLFYRSLIVFWQKSILHAPDSMSEKAGNSVPLS